MEISSKSADDQIKSLEKLKDSRDELGLENSLNEVAIACKHNLNLVEPIIKAAKHYATIGEIVQKMKDEFGEWQETVGF